MKKYIADKLTTDPKIKDVVGRQGDGFSWIDCIWCFHNLILKEVEV